MKIKKCQYLKTVLISMLVVPAMAMAIPTFSPQSGIPSQDESATDPRDVFSGGVAWIDYDNDGDDDVFIPNTSSGSSRFFRNDGPDASQWSCSNYPLDANGNPISAQFCDISQQAGTVLENLNSTAAVVADYDSDGCDDLFVTNTGGRNASANTLLRNTLCDAQPAATFFVDMTEPAGLSSEMKPSYAASFGDIDNDGDLDLYVSHWSRSNSACENNGNDLYLNDGIQNGVTQFTKALAGEHIEVRTAGSENLVDPLGVDNNGCSFAGAFSDYNNDGRLDIFVVNDNVCNPSARKPSEVYENKGLRVNGQGKPVLQFERVGNTINMGQNFQGMGIARGDYDNDGDLDYYRSNIGAGYLSTNNGAGMFLSVLFATDPVPLGDGPAAPGCGNSPMGWGPVFFDPDNDGDVDLLRVNADSVSYFNNNTGQLETSRSDTGINGRGNGLAISDFDGDTDMDVLIHSSTGQIGLFANNTANAGNALLIKLNGLSPNRDAIGAIIRVNANSTQQMREISAGASHGSSHSFVQHFGLGSASFATSVSVFWPSGCTQVLNNVAASIAQGGAYIVDEKDAPCARVNGQITSGDGSGAGGILISAIDQTSANAGAIHGSTVTQADGRFALGGLPLKTPMKLVVSKGGITFTPAEGAVYLFNAGGQQIHDFTATSLGGAVLGKVADSSTGQGVINVSIQLNFGTTASILTDEIGDYRLAALTEYDYYLSASKPGYAIISNGPVTVDGREVEKQFTATCLGGSMSGLVIDAATGNGIQGATVSLNFGAVAETTTDVNGFYAFTGLAGYDYYVDAAKVGFVIAGQGPVIVDGNCIDHKFSTVLN